MNKSKAQNIAANASPHTQKFLEGLNKERGRNESHRIVNPNQQSNEGKSQDDSYSSSQRRNHVSVEEEEQEKWSSNKGRLGRFSGIPEVEVKVLGGHDKGTQYKGGKLETR